jgi:NAD(P)-dependent dehydrogenase (short-subunit alcohol dehydrogenase family)
LLSGAVGFVRSYGKHLPEEHITLNAICPHVVRTNMSTPPFYNDLQDKDLLTQMKEVVHAFMHFVDHSDQSGECLEIGPVGTFKVREAPSALNEESKTLNGLISIRGRPLHEVVS